jgi:hypothetical protein
MMPALLDNRAALTDGPADPQGAFCPFASNATVVPRSLAPGGAEGFPTPGSPEWGRLNRRRGELIRRKVRGGLSPGEDEELEWLQRETLAAVDRAFPRPPVDFRALAELEERLKEGPKRETP